MASDLLGMLTRGYALQRASRFEEAETLYRQVLQEDPENAHALNLLGVICVNSGRHAEAVALIERAVRQGPADAEVHGNLGLAQMGSGQAERALASFETAVRLQPGNPVAHNHVGNALLELGRPEAALRSYERAARLAPGYAEALSNASRALLQLYRIPEAERAARASLNLRQDLPHAWISFADVLVKRCRFDEAISAYRTARRLAPPCTEAMINESVAHKEKGDIASARQCLEAASLEDARNPRIPYLLGVLLEQTGDSAGAEAAYLSALNLNPKYAAAHYQLTQLKGREISEGEITAMRALFEDPETPPEPASQAAFGLARASEATGDFERAMDYLEAGHRLILSGATYDDRRTRSFYRQIETCLTADAVASPPFKISGPQAPVPILVVGMPRSGTSLTEQILASHPDVSGAGESSFLEDLVAEAGQLTGKRYPECLAHLSMDQRSALAEAYLARLGAGQDGARFVVDKTPLNFQYLGLASAVLPDVRFVHCHRNPADNCMSIYRLPFDRQQTYAHSLSTLREFYRAYASLMTHWRTVLGVRLLDVAYENLVADLGGEARRLLDHIGLPFDEAVLAFHKTERIVRTPSANQVRQPIYTDSVGYWRRYGERARDLETLL